MIFRGLGIMRNLLLDYPSYNVLKCERRFTLGLNDAKNTDYIKKCFRQKFLRIKFPTKNPVDTYLHPSQEWNQGLQRLPCLKYYDALEWESKFTARLNAPKNIYQKMLQTKIDIIDNFQCSAIKSYSESIYFPILVIAIFKKWQSLELHFGGRQRYVSIECFVGNCVFV